MASPTTPRYCKYFFSARGCNQGNDCKYLHQQMDEVRTPPPPRESLASLFAFGSNVKIRRALCHHGLCSQRCDSAGTPQVRMELPCTALSVDIETTGCWPGVHKIVAIGVALFQLHPSHQVRLSAGGCSDAVRWRSLVARSPWAFACMSCDRQVVEVDRRLFQFKVNYPQDFDEITMRDFWHVQGRMELLDALQDGAKSEEEAIKEFYDYYTEVRPASVCRKALLLSQACGSHDRFAWRLAQVCYKYPKFFLITDNPVMDLGFLNLSIATKLRKPPLTYRPILRSPREEPAELRHDNFASPSITRSSSGLSETESDDELSSEGGEEESSDEDGFGESGEEDCGADCDTAGTASSDQLLAQAPEMIERVKLQKPADSGKKLASFYDDYSAPHFAIDLNSFACGLVGLHLPPFRRAGGTFRARTTATPRA